MVNELLTKRIVIRVNQGEIWDDSKLQGERKRKKRKILARKDALIIKNNDIKIFFSSN